MSSPLIFRPHIVIASEKTYNNILDFSLFNCPEFHSEFQALEVTRYTQLTDKMSLHYFELPKLPAQIDKDSSLLLWLSLFNANTEEEIKRIEALEVPDMEQAIGAYRNVSATDEFKELERMRSRARHDEAAALNQAAALERDKWQAVVAEKDAAISKKDAVISKKNAAIAEKDATISEKDIQIAKLQAELDDIKSHSNS